MIVRFARMVAKNAANKAVNAVGCWILEERYGLFTKIEAMKAEIINNIKNKEK